MSKFSLRLAPLFTAFAFAFAAVAVQPISAFAQTANSTQPSVPWTVQLKCDFLKSYANSAKTTLHNNQAFMQAAFETELNLMQSNWSSQDTAVKLWRNIAESTFNSTVTAFQNRPGIFIKKTEVRAAALNEYKDGIVNALHTFQTNIDSYRTAYREDMLALVKAHQKALTDIVNTQVDAINAALDVATTNCTDNHAAQNLFNTIGKANWTLAEGVVKQEFKDIDLAIKLVTKRDKQFQQEQNFYNAASIELTGKLIAAFVTQQ